MTCCNSQYDFEYDCPFSKQFIEHLNTNYPYWYFQRYECFRDTYIVHFSQIDGSGKTLLRSVSARLIDGVPKFSVALDKSV